MRIQNHRLRSEQHEQTVKILTTPNQGGTITPKYLVIHYSAGASAESTAHWLMNPAANASAHLVIAMDGSITQLAQFNKKAWHTGASRWNELVGMNNYSIGIELDIPAKCATSAAGGYHGSAGSTRAQLLWRQRTNIRKLPLAGTSSASSKSSHASQ